MHYWSIITKIVSIDRSSVRHVYAKRYQISLRQSGASFQKESLDRDIYKLTNSKASLTPHGPPEYWITPVPM